MKQKKKKQVSRKSGKKPGAKKSPAKPSSSKKTSKLVKKKTPAKAFASKKNLPELEIVDSKKAYKTQKPASKFDHELNDILKNESSLEVPEERRRRRRDDDEGEPSGEAASEQDYTLDKTPMKIYLKQIEHIPLLTPDEEIELSTKVQQKLPDAEQARERMIRGNLRLVISIAKRYSNMGLAFSDLVEEGNIGLMRAVEKFNPERGYRFSTYASWWIKQALMRSLSNQGKTIRIPVYMYDVISKWRRVRDGLMQRLNRIPTRKEIAKIMQVPVSKVKEIENIAGRPSSLNAPVSLDGTAELIDLIEDDSSHGPDVQIGEALKNERILKLLEKLDEREKRILELRFGLGDDQPHTLEEVAAQFSITRERVRQIEGVALQKIRYQLDLEKDRLDNYIKS